jgi:hypothetical protein
MAQDLMANVAAVHPCPGLCSPEQTCSSADTAG